MATSHLGFQVSDYVFRSENTTFLSQHDLESDVQQQITELGLQLCIIPSRDGFADFVRFFQQVGEQRCGRLRGVPGAVGAEETDERKSAIKLHRVHSGPILDAL